MAWVAWVAWDKILASKKHGGLGVGSIRALNLALLGKWWWRFRTQTNVLWVKVIKALYGEHGGLEPQVKAKNKGTWKHIINLPVTMNKKKISFSSHFNLVNSVWKWDLDTTKIFTVKSLRTHCDNILLPSMNTTWRWNRAVPIKINIFAWSMRLNKLPTLDNLNKFGVTDNRTCYMCKQEEESVEHLFIDCAKAKLTWKEITNWWPNLGPTNHTLEHLFVHMETQHMATKRTNIIGAVILAYMWNMWKSRNEIVFRSANFDHTKIANDVKTDAFQWLKARSSMDFKVNWEKWNDNPNNLDCI